MTRWLCRTDAARRLVTTLMVMGAVTGVGCRPKGHGITIQNKGSDTMVNVAQAWAELYQSVEPGVSVEVSGGGSGTGMAALIRGTVDIANASRDIREEEATQVRHNTGREATEFTVGYDALAVYVNPANALESVDFEQLAAIYAEGGVLTRWSQLGVSVPGCRSDAIVRISRQSSSGTYDFFRERVLNRRDFKLGSLDLSGSKEVVELVSTTPCAIGYSGMGYATPDVKMLKVAQAATGVAYAPTVAATWKQDYPIARSLHMYTVGQPSGHVKAYVDWVLSGDGQRVLEQSGYVPLPPATRSAQP
jgi:phosphate transport system substrate-binding protein